MIMDSDVDADVSAERHS